MKAIQLILISLIFSINSSSQNAVLEKFTASEVNERVLLNWTLGKGYTCNGTDVMRSSDSVHFDKIWHLEGICGSQSQPVPYSYDDSSPILNKKGYYRLDFGGLESSKIISITVIDFRDFDFALFPNPVSSEAKLYFRNDKSDLFLFTVYDVNGKSILSKDSRDKYFNVKKENLPAGLYLFTLENKSNGKVSSGKFMFASGE